MLKNENNESVLYYVYDPMCSWCWGYAPVWEELSRKLPQWLMIKYQLGGLAPDSTEPMPAEMQGFLQATWKRISNELGTEFNFDFWQKCLPRRSTYPACRAILIARESNQEQEMLSEIQKAYYLEAKNPSDTATLTALLSKLNIPYDSKEDEISSSEVNEQLLLEILETRELPIQGFPSLVLKKNNEMIAIPIDYKNWQSTYEAIMKHLK